MFKNTFYKCCLIDPPLPYRLVPNFDNDANNWMLESLWNLINVLQASTKYMEIIYFYIQNES